MKKIDLALLSVIIIMITKSSQIKDGIYECKICDYVTSKKCNLDKHLSTLKHKKRENDNKSSKNFLCENCGKKYKFSSGLSRHKLKCGTQICNESDIDKKFNMLMNQNQELREQLIELSNKPTNSTIINNKMTINLFLNQVCSGAINLSDFINKLNISHGDLNYTIDNGYVKGINNIFIKNLETLKPSERPIYCTDRKRLRFYIKEDDEWLRDNQNIEKSIDKITVKQIQKIKEWENEHPEWNKCDQLTEKYLKMVQEVIINSSDKEKNIESIIKNLSNNTEIKDIML